MEQKTITLTQNTIDHIEFLLESDWLNSRDFQESDEDKERYETAAKAQEEFTVAVRQEA